MCWLTINEYKCASSQQSDYVDEIEKKKRKNSPSSPNRNVLIEYLSKSDLKKPSHRRIITSKLAILNFFQSKNFIH